MIAESLDYMEAEQDALVASLARTMRARMADTDAPPRTDSSLLDWGRRYLPEHFMQPSSLMHRWLAAELDESRSHRGMKINLVGPRGGAKSTVGTLAHALRCACEEAEPLIWIVMETRDQAADHLSNIKTHLESNELIARDYPRAFGRGSIWSRDKIRLRNGVAIEAYGTGQKIRGRRFGSNRPSLIFSDDVQSDSVMMSALQREKDWTWYNGSLLKAGTKRTNFVNMATALHREAIGLRLCRTAGWTSRIFQAIEKWPDSMGLWEQWADIYHDVDAADHKEKAQAFYDSNREAMHAGAVLLWPEEEDLLTLMMVRAEGGASVFEREKQSRPVSPEQCEWPESYFDDVWFDAWPAEYQARVMTLDPSKGKDAKRSDYSAFILCQYTNGIMYIDADLKRRPTPEIVSDGTALVRQFRPQAFAVESNCNQDLLGYLFEAESARLGVPGGRPLDIQNQGNKQARIRSLGPMFAQKRIRFKKGSQGALLLVSQLKDFPDPHSHDDGPDALEMAMRLVAEKIQGPRPDGLGNKRTIGRD